MDAFFTSTLTVALAEIGDKTQLLSLLLAARFRNKTAIIAGILVATLLNHAVSAWLGNWLGQFLQSELGRWVIGGSFVALALWLLIPDKEDDTDSRFDQYGPFVVSTLLFFLAEIGDKTQVATVLLGAQFDSVIWVTLGTTLGMLIANVPVVYAGEYLMQRIPMNATRITAAVVFAAVGIWHSGVLA
ncbi:TMEM165/GDT1 family protein [Neptuniibacter sp. CAU 1671]|uniref:TMEM165/GDT1 family protein n=1 Tax=Neptuniibacter sp. CAU 1671 TaxID=3032593 RepID=UPI0023DA7CCE|nr:TMEM165/GDT1 family protein [Neptuniibacter sp. CAU 1671]MDF2181619.1 TMEM165/GDT1 family protein [Neptuniibacter sp. CAU 1671]